MPCPYDTALTWAQALRDGGVRAWLREARRLLRHESPPHTTVTGDGRVTVSRNIVYGGDAAHTRHKLDVYMPTAAAGSDVHAGSTAAATATSRGVVLFVHGGSWQSGGRTHQFGTYSNVGKALARRGLICVIPSYRLSQPDPYMISVAWVVVLSVPWLLWLGLLRLLRRGRPFNRGRLMRMVARHVSLGALLVLLRFLALKRRQSAHSVQHPTHTQDVASALAWTRRNAAHFGGDGSRIAIVGHSAGAQIAAMLALDPSYLMNARAPPPSEAIAGVVSISGVLHHDLDSAFHTFLLRAFMVPPAFGFDPARWDEAFPMALAKALASQEDDARTRGDGSGDRGAGDRGAGVTDGGAVARNRRDSVRVPPFALLTAADEPGLHGVTAEFASHLVRAGVHVDHVDPFAGLDHWRIVARVGSGDAANDAVMDAITGFISGQCGLRNDPP